MLGQTTLNNYSIYQAVSGVLLIFGMWKIFKKCGTKGWYALIPGYRFFKLGQCGNREREGLAVFILELFTTAISVALNLPGVKVSMTDDYLAFGLLILLLIKLGYRMRIYSGICRRFNRSRVWLIPWAVCEWVPALWFGFDPRFQPVSRHTILDEELLAGTDPVSVEYARKIAGQQNEGLTVILRDRTVRDLSRKRYLLKDVYFTIPKNQLVLLLGGSGSGKTTLVNAVLGYEKANAEIFLNGENVYQNYEQMKYRIGFVPQQDLLRPHDTVYNTLQDAARLRMPAGSSAEDIKKRIAEVMSLLGLEAGSSGLVSKKSGGMRKRISIGCELISDPELFVLDEPDSGLDGVIARELFEKLSDIAHNGSIVLTITHTPDRVAHLFDRVIVLARDSGRVGRLAFAGTPDEARKFFGKETMEEIVMAVNRKEEGGEGRADEFIRKYSEYMGSLLAEKEKEDE